MHATINLYKVHDTILMGFHFHLHMKWDLNVIILEGQRKLILYSISNIYIVITKKENYT